MTDKPSCNKSALHGKHLFILIIIFAGFGCKAGSANNKEFSWDINGEVSLPNNRTIHSGLQVVTSAITFKGQLFLAGYTINEDGENIPATTRVKSSQASKDLDIFESPIKQFYVYEDSLHLLETSGAVYDWTKGQWLPSTSSFKPNSTIVSLTPNLVACIPTDARKTHFKVGQCYTNNWYRNINWIDVVPQSCGDKIRAIERKKNQSTLIILSPQTGEMQSSKVLDAAPPPSADLCQL